MSETTKFDEWALVELFGHQKIVGRVTETSMAGGAFLRVDVPALPPDGPPCTRFFSPGAIYSINPVTEEVARGLLTQSRFRNEPVSRYDLPQIAEKVQEEHCVMCGERESNCACSQDNQEED